jgi:hypothetical protein
MTYGTTWNRRSDPPKIQEFLFPRVSKISASGGEVPFLAGDASPNFPSYKGVNCGCLTRHKDPEREDA